MDNKNSELMYDKEIKCPICFHEFNTKKVRVRKLSISEKHTDFFVEYKDVNPIDYYVWVCYTCGYSSTEKEFFNIKGNEEEIIKKNIYRKWTKQEFGKERNLNQVETSYKLAIFVGELIKRPKSYIGMLCLRLAWVYRRIKIESGENISAEGRSLREDDKEYIFLNNAKISLEKAYEEERMPLEIIDEVSMTYLIGELNRRLKNYEDAITWYDRALNHPDKKYHRQVILRAKDQWKLAKEEYDKTK